MSKSAKSGFAKTHTFGRSGVFDCRCCGRATRQTGDDNDSIDLCVQCYELSGQENSLSDSGEFYGTTPEQIIQDITYLGTLKGANVTVWDELKDKALALTGATVADLLATPSRKRMVAAINDEGDIVPTCYRTAKKYGWTVIAKLY